MDAKNWLTKREEVREKIACDGLRRLCVRMCVCVCVREREREWEIVFAKARERLAFNLICMKIFFAFSFLHNRTEWTLTSSGQSGERKFGFAEEF